MKMWIIIVSCIFVCVGVSVLAIYGFRKTEIVRTFIPVQRLDPPQDLPEPSRIYENNNSSLDPAFIGELSRSVVKIVMIARLKVGDQTVNAVGACSATVLWESGGWHYLLSSNHCFTHDGADATLLSMEIFVAGIPNGEVVSLHAESDSALIRVPSHDSLVVIPASIGDSDSLRIGNFLYVIGYPLAYDLAVSTGIVRNTRVPHIDRGRTVGYDYNSFTFSNAINPGNSGGVVLAVIDGRVEIVGTVSAYFTRSNDLNIARGINSTVIGLRSIFSNPLSVPQLVCPLYPNEE